MKKYLINLCKENLVTIVFAIMCVFGFIASGQTISYVLSEVVSRLFRNFGLVFSLIIPVIAGIGLNFGIVLGAMAAQAAIIFVTHWRIPGIEAIIVAAIISLPLSILFGYLLGRLFNKTKGQEMITGMIVGFFANGLYQLFFLVLIGTLIPMKDDRIMIYTGIGIKDTLKLEDNVVNALDNVYKIRMDRIAVPIIITCILYMIFRMYKLLKNKVNGKIVDKTPFYNCCVRLLFLLILLSLATLNKTVVFAMKFTMIPFIPLLLMIIFGLFITYLEKTKLGHDFRAIGSNMTVANASGIDVDKTRIIAIILSTLMSAWGQLIFLQNIGNFTTYSSHQKVGTFAVAAILVGGASTKKATITQAVVGIILFHTLFVIAPQAGKALLNDAAYGEYFREAVSYGVITLSLVLHISSRKKANS